MSFFFHLSTEIKINNLELRIPEDIEFGSDDEKAMTKAITDAFPNATRRLCTKHLKDNVKHYLQNRVGVDSKERTDIIELLFSTEGIVNADDTIDFETKSVEFYSYPISVYSMSNFSEFISRKDRSFSNYFRKIEIAWSN